MKILKNLTVLLPVLLLAPLAQSAESLIWDETGVGNNPPQIIYKYTNGSGSKISLDTADIEDVPYYMGATFTVTGMTSEYGAGFGFYWNVTEEEDYSLTPRKTDIGTYKGVCLTYSATAPIRMDFIQQDIQVKRDEDGNIISGDDNFFGMWLPSTEGASINKFVDVDSLDMDWKSKNDWKFNAKKQLGLQFNYKGAKVKKYGTEAIVKITALRLADECPQHAPEVNKDYATDYRLDEGDSLVVRLKDVFYDADGDNLSISITWTGTGVNLNYDDTQPRSLSDSIVFTTVKNPADTASMSFTFTATDPTKKTVSWKMNIKPIDSKHRPSIRDTTFDVFQGQALKLPGRFSFYGENIEDRSYLIYDVDGDEVELFLDSTCLPEHGTFNFNLLQGTFTYLAASDFVGLDSFALYAVEKNNPESISDTAIYKINVKDVNDPPVMTFMDSTYFIYTNIDELEGEQLMFGDSSLYFQVYEDFKDTLWIEIDESKFTVEDEDSEVTLKAKANEVLNAEIVTVLHKKYIAVTAKENANGFGVITFYADDGEFQVGIEAYVKVIAVEDLPIAVDDQYDAVQGTKLSVNVKNGVLKNDKNVDDPDEKLTAKIVEKPKNGTVTFKEDGSFTYKSNEDFRGEDEFTYVCLNENEVESLPAKVVIKVANKNMAPTIAGEVADSLEKALAALVEDKLTSGKIFKTSDLKKWFVDPDGDPVTFDAKNEDGKLIVTVTDDAIKVSPVSDSSGTSELIIIATDSTGSSIELALAVFIKPVNDKPVAASIEDARFDVETEDWEMKIDLDSLVFDADRDTLKYVVSKKSILMAEFLKTEIDGHYLKVSPQKKGLEKGKDYQLKIEASDAEYTVDLVITFHTLGAASLRAIAAQPKATWQNAVAANRGAVALMDMQGRVMWTAKLPVNEADVRAASAKVQGVKVLRVNSQTWTIK